MFFLLLSYSDDSTNPTNNDKDGNLIEVPAKSLIGEMKKLLYYPNGQEDENGNFIEIYHVYDDYDLGAGSINIAKMSKIDYSIATGIVDANGNISLTFNTKVPSEILAEFYQFDGASVSPSNMKTSIPLTDISLTLSDGQQKTLLIHDLPIPDGEGNFGTVTFEFMCATHDGVVTGINNAGYTLNLNLKKGWNIIKTTSTEDVKKVETVTSFPSDAYFNYGRIIQF